MSEYQPATRRAPMTVAIVATYPPRPCGIAVFSGDLRNAILGADSSVEVEIVAMVRDGRIRRLAPRGPHDPAERGGGLRGGGRRPQPTRRRRADRARVRHLRRRGRLSRAVAGGRAHGAGRRHPAHGAGRAVRGAVPHPASAVRTRRPRHGVHRDRQAHGGVPRARGPGPRTRGAARGAGRAVRDGLGRQRQRSVASGGSRGR